MKTIGKLFLSTLFFVCFTVVYAQAPSSINIAIAQLRTNDVGNFTKIQTLVKQAKSKGADLIVFPESSVFGWLNHEAFVKSEPVPGYYSNKFAEIAKSENIWLVTGLAERGPKIDSEYEKDVYSVYDSAILIDPHGKIVLHTSKFNVLKNAFDPAMCKTFLNQEQCNYTPGNLSDIKTVNTPFGKIAILVCSDAFTYPPHEALDALKKLKPDLVIIPWGITASTISECGSEWFNDASTYAAKAASYLNAFVIGANAVGENNYGKYHPSVYCGTSGYAIPGGEAIVSEKADTELTIFQIETAPQSTPNYIFREDL